MMITKQNIMNNPKAIKNYCLRVLLFLFLLRDSILANFVIILMPIFSAFFSIFNIDPFLDMGLFALSADIFFLYCFAIITGIFKKLEKLNFVSAILIVFIISCLWNYSNMIQFQFSPFKIGFVKHHGFIHFIPILYLVYRFFQVFGEKIRKNIFVAPCEEFKKSILKENIKNTLKMLFEYCLRVLLFLFLNRNFVTNIFLTILGAIFIVLFKTNIEGIVAYIQKALLFFDIFFLYCFAIITGIFKKLEKLNFVSAFISICIVNVLLNYSSMFQIQLFPLKIAFVKQEMTHTLLILYLLHATICFLRKRLISNKLKN